MPILTADYLYDVSAQIFEGAGTPRERAQTVARLLVQSNLAGHDSHGIIRIPQYLHMIRSGNLVPDATVEVLHEAPSTAMLDGHWGFGQVIATHAMTTALGKAQQHAVSVVTVKHSNHIGRLSDYAMIAAEQECIGMMTVNNHGSGLNAAPFGGRERRLSTNPICVAIPTGDEPFVLDITTSVVAEGKVRVMRNQGKSLPEGWILDRDGHPSTNPADLYDGGAILPFGGMVAHKGFGLSMVVDILSGALSRAGCSGHADAQLGNGIFMFVIHIPHFLPFDEFCTQVQDFIHHVKNTPLAPGFSEILIPGEPEARTRRHRQTHGIEVDDTTWNQIRDAAQEVGVEITHGI